MHIFKMDNNKYNSRQVYTCCRKKLSIQFRGKSKEYNGWYEVRGKKFARVTVPKGRKSIPQGTYSSMANQLHLSVNGFDRLLSCKMESKEYARHAQQLADQELAE